MAAKKSKLPSSDGNLSFVVEKVRLVGYTSFWIVVVTGVALTTLFGHVDMKNTVLMKVFGYNNICVYFDAAPATYVLPWVWGFTLVFLLSYIGAHWLQMRAEVQEGLLNKNVYKLLSGLKIFEAVTLVIFSLCFAVQPEAWDETLYIHTVPFLILQIGLVSLAMSNTLHGIQSGYWRRLDLPSWFESGAKIYVSIFAVVVCFKILADINAMAGGPWWQQTASFAKVAQVFDLLFLFCAAIIPMAKALYLVWARSDKLEVIQIAMRTA